MKNYEVLQLVSALKEVDAPDMGPDFNYAISANLDLAEMVSEHIRKAIAPSEDYMEYEKELQGLREDYAEKDDDGEPRVLILDNGSKQYLIPGIELSDSPFNKEVSKLQKEFEEVLKKRQVQLDFLQEENKEFTPVEIYKEDIPSGLTRSAMDTVFKLMKWAKQ